MGMDPGSLLTGRRTGSGFLGVEQNWPHVCGSGAFPSGLVRSLSKDPLSPSFLLTLQGLQGLQGSIEHHNPGLGTETQSQF